ncbi:hypothetical protein ACA910_012109 [Epithemia clementina (nom. ined.)]
MGHVKDVYMRYAMAGDEFVGQCLCLLPYLQNTFGISPPHFGPWVGKALIQHAVSSQFPVVHQIEGFGKMCCMCLASTLYHHEYISNFASNHIAQITSYVFRHAATLEFFMENLDAVVTKTPWEDRDHHFSGIPSHLMAVHKLMEVKTEQHALVDKFIDRMKVVLDEQGIEGGNLTVVQLQAIIADVLEKSGKGRTNWKVGHYNNNSKIKKILSKRLLLKTATTPFIFTMGNSAGSHPIGASPELACWIVGDIGGLVTMSGRCPLFGCSQNKMWSGLLVYP